MKKVGLLLFSLSVVANTFAQWDPAKNWLIKDGKLQPGVTCNAYNDAEGIPCSQIIEKDGYAELTHAWTYSDCRLDIDKTIKPFSLKGKYLHIEYQLPEEVMLYEEVASQNLKLGYALDKKEKPMLIVSAVSDTLSDANFDNAKYFSLINVDGKFNPEACKGFVTYEGCSYWKNDEKVGAVFLSYNREQGYVSDYPAMKIKNMYYYEPEGDEHPFFSCGFDGSDTWTEAIDLAKTGSEPYVKAQLYPYGMVPGALNDTVGKYVTDVKMLYQNGADNWTGSDGSGFLSTELFHGLRVKSSGFAEYNKKIKDQDIELGFANIPLPEGNSGNMIIQCLVTLDPENNPVELTGEYKNDYLPVYVQFDNSEDIQVFKSSIINGIYTAEKDKVTIPSGAKSVSVKFKINPTYTYIVDELILSTGYKTSVANVNGESKSLAIYPNPVYDQIAFSGVENVETVDIISMNGANVACSLVNGKINVSNLAAGEYILVVNKSISGKFIKK